MVEDGKGIQREYEDANEGSALAVYNLFNLGGAPLSPLLASEQHK